MDLFETNIRNYWNYYLELESELVQMNRYVEFDVNNNSVFSIDFLKLYQAICSEIDVVGKHIAFHLDNSFDKNAKGINYWWYAIQDRLLLTKNVNDYWDNSVRPCGIRSFKVHNYLMNNDYSPWEKYEVEKVNDANGKARLKLKKGSNMPEWWSDYNSVKHHRTEKTDGVNLNFTKANLKNVCESIAALYTLEIALVEITSSCRINLKTFVNKSRLFNREEYCSIKDIDELFQK